MKKTVALAFFLLARTATAQLTCNGAFELSYPGIGPFVNVGDVVTMRSSFGAGNILGGTALFVNNFAVELACNSDFPVIPCVAEPNTVRYQGDATISTNCNTCFNLAGGLPGVPTPCTWTSNNPGGGTVPNSLLFQLPPFVALRVPEATPPGFCRVDIQVQKLAESMDMTPALIEQNAGYIPSPVAGCPNCRAVCDNQILASQVVQSAALLGGKDAAFQCYEAPRRATDKPNVTVTVTDPFGTDTVVAQRIHPFCAPSDLNGADPAAPLNPVHLAGYTLGGVNSQQFATPTVTASTALGAFSLKVGTPVTLFVPTGKSVLPAPPPALPPASNHYLCHQAENVSGPKVQGTFVTLEDQFSTPGTFQNRLTSVRWLCAPAQKNQEPIVDPTAFLLCFTTNAPNPPVGPGLLGVTASINNQFGLAEIDLTQPLNLCVAATVQ